MQLFQWTEINSLWKRKIRKIIN